MPNRREEPANAKPKAKSEQENKKKAETTILTPEELRAISGGLGTTGPTQPPGGPKPNVVIKPT